MSLLELRNITVSYGDLTVLNDVSLELDRGEWLMVIGPNGAGKSTLISAVGGTAPHKGEVLFRGVSSVSMKPRDIARCVGTLSQSHSVGYSFSVRELVGLGRYPYRKGLMGGRDDDDDRMIEEAIHNVGLADMADRSLLTLSGGELQRAFIAQLFAQDPSVLMLDEPTNNLDLVYQKEVFDLLKEWVSQRDRAILSVVHDLGLAKAYGNKALLLDRGSAAAYGEMDTVFSDSMISSTYRLDIRQWMNKLYSHWTD